MAALSVLCVLRGDAVVTLAFCTENRTESLNYTNVLPIIITSVVMVKSQIACIACGDALHSNKH